MVDQQLLLIDSGNDDSSVRKAYRDIEGVEVIGVLNTHSHADHCGGNAYIQRQFGAPVYAPEIESAFIESPILEPVYLYGAYPLNSLHNKFLMAKPSVVNQKIKKHDSLEFAFKNRLVKIRTVGLAGHSPNQMGYITEDNVAYLGDALIASEMVQKHPLIFTYNVTEHYMALNTLETLNADGYVIAHGGFYENIHQLIVDNRKALDQTQEAIVHLISQGPNTFDGIHKHLCDIYGLTESVPQHLLNRSVVKAHVRHLIDHDVMTLTSDSGMLFIQNKI
jgi:glyoxylase-like metal-dependent hydrolase (beta-lactamase superfamily II)